MGNASFKDIKGFDKIEIVGEYLNTFRENPHYNSNKFYIFFTARNAKKDYTILDIATIAKAIREKKIKLVNYLTGDEYTLGDTQPDPHGNMFIISRFFTKKEVNIMEITANKFSGYAPISVAFILSDETAISTEFMEFSGFDSKVFVYKEKED